MKKTNDKKKVTLKKEKEKKKKQKEPEKTCCWECGSDRDSEHSNFCSSWYS